MRTAGAGAARRLLAVALAALSVTLGGASDARADTRVGWVVVLAPDPRTTVAAPVEVVLRSDDRAPAGMAIWLYVDGEPLDPDTGALGGATIPPLTMAAGERHRVQVVGLGAGAHTLTVEVSESETGRPRSIDVPFSVSGEGSGSSAIYLGILIGLIAMAFLLTRWRMLRGRPGPGAQAGRAASRKE